MRHDVTANHPDAFCVADITSITVGSGFLYLAVVLENFCLWIVGWAMAGHLRAELGLAPLDIAVAQRNPDGVMYHSAHGQYTSLAFGARNKEADVRLSLESVGDC